MTLSTKNILVIGTTWLVLYVLAVYSVYIALKYSGSRYWATPIWVLLYFVPGYLAGHKMHKSWVISGMLIGIIGSMLWVLHAQLSITHVGTLINTIANTLVCLLGAWLGQRKVAG